MSRWIWLALVFLGACTPTVATRVPSNVSQPTQTSVAAIEETILYRGDAGRSGVYDEPAIRSLTWVKWQRSFKEDAYFPIYADDMLYIGTASGKLLALNPDSGETKWSFQAENGPILAVALAEETLYFGAGERGFYAVDAQKGTLDWSFEADSSVWSSSPLIMNDTAYFGSDTGTVYALDLQTHTPLWTFDAASGVLWHLAGDEERIYVPTQNFLYALEANTGKELWHASTSDKWNAPAVATDIVYAGNGSHQFMALDAITGQERWVFMDPAGRWSEWSAPVITEETVYVGSSNNRMYALDTQTGKEQWHFSTQDWATTDPILTDGVLYFGVGAHANLAEPSADRLFYALDATTGNPLWTFKASGLVYSGATIGKDAIYFKTLNNILYALH